MGHPIINLGDIIRSVRIGHQLLDHFAIHFYFGFQIYTELEHITRRSLSTFRQEVLDDVQILEVRMVLVFELAAVTSPGISRRCCTFTYLYDLTVYFDFFNLLISIDFNLINGIFYFLIRQFEYGCLTCFQRKESVFIYRHFNRIAFCILAIFVVNAGAYAGFIFIFCVFI